MTINPSILLTLSFSLLSTILGESSHPNLVLDWAGNPVKANTTYELWLVGHHTAGTLGMGSFADESLGHRFAIDKHRYCNKSFDGDLIALATKALVYNTTSDLAVPVATDCAIGFANNLNKPLLRINREVGSIVHNFITNSRGALLDLDFWFQFERINGTTENNPHLYKLISKVDDIPMDIILITNSVGERSLYLNQNNSIPDAWGTRISFVKSEQSEHSESRR